MRSRSVALRTAGAVQAAEAAMVLAASVISGLDTVAGRSYQLASGIALTIIGVGTSVALAWVAVGLARSRPWSRTPALLTQLFVGMVGIHLLQGHRLLWGAPSVALAVAGFALVLRPRGWQGWLVIGLLVVALVLLRLFLIP